MFSGLKRQPCSHIRCYEWLLSSMNSPPVKFPPQAEVAFTSHLSNTQIAVEHELMLCTEKPISSPNAQTPFALSGSSPSILHCGSVAAAQARRPTLGGTQMLKIRPKMKLLVSLSMCCHTTANYRRVSLSFRHQDT